MGYKKKDCTHFGIVTRRDHVLLRGPALKKQLKFQTIWDAVDHAKSICDGAVVRLPLLTPAKAKRFLRRSVA